MVSITVEESLRELGRETAQLSEAALRPHGINLNQYITLAAIADHGPINATALAEITAMYGGSVAVYTSALRGKGYVVRDENNNGLPKPLMITVSGMRLLAECKKSLTEVDRELRRYIPDHLAEQLAEAYIALKNWYDRPL